MAAIVVSLVTLVKVTLPVNVTGNVISNVTTTVISASPAPGPGGRDAGRCPGREAGVLLRRAAALGARCRDLTVTGADAADLTCLPKAAFTAALADVPADGGSRHYVGMTDADLAAATLQGYDSAEAHLGLRFPHVAALRDAARVLIAQHEATRPQAPLAAWLDGPPAPGADELTVLYQAHVEAIAAGRPVTRVENLQVAPTGDAPDTD